VATYGAIAAVSEAILGLLERACPRPEFDGASFRLYLAGDFRAPMEEGFSLFLHRVVASTVRRNLPPRIDEQGRRYRPALPLDLYYLLTPWSRSAERQQRLLALAMRAMDDTPTLDAGFLNHYSRPDASFFPDEAVTIVFEPVAIQDLLAIWEFAKHNIQVSATYVARMVPIESLAPADQTAPVQTRELRYGKGPR
jgi:hypothetical protein